MSEGTHRPLVSIGLPAYNGGEFIRETLESLMAQDYPNFELNICDNASTDGTGNICREFAAQDHRVRYFRNESNLGSMVNFEKVFRLAKGEYFMWASAHDIWEPAFVSSCAQIMEDDPDVVLTYAQADWIDPAGRSLGLVKGKLDTRGLGQIARCHVVLWGLQNGCPVYGMARREALSQIPLGKTAVAPDMLLLFELSFLGEFACVPQLLFHFRRSDCDGDMDVYLAKSIGKRVSRAQKMRMYRRMVIEHVKAVDTHLRRHGRSRGLLRFGSMLSVLFGVTVKYRWLRQQLAEEQ